MATYSRKVIPDIVILDSGLTHNISKEDVELQSKIANKTVVSNMEVFLDNAQHITAELLSVYGKLDMPIWKERATNCSGILMIGKPDGKHVLSVLGLI